MDLSLHQLRLFLAVVEHETISAAAADLGYTPSAVSQQLTGLERACGVAVLERVGRGVRLTDAGRVLAKHARFVLTAAEEALVAVSRVNEVVDGTVEIGAYESVAATLIPPLLVASRDRYPQLVIRVRQMEPELSIPALQRGDLDLAFTIDYPHAPISASEGVHAWTITHDRFHLVVPEDDPIPDGPVDLASMRDRPFISGPTSMSCGRCVAAACRLAGFDPYVTHSLGDYPTSIRLVAAGEGVALVPDLGLIHAPSGVRILSLRQPVTRTIQLAVREASMSRPSNLAVRDALIHAADSLKLVTPTQPIRESVLL